MFPRSSRHLLLACVMLLAVLVPCAGYAEDIPLDTCDRLPVIEVAVAGVQSKLRFLVDTAATSMLNSKSFGAGDPSTISVTSWSGTVEARSRQVTLRDFVIGHHHLKDLRLPAVDLSAIGNACGKRIDGILGIDLLSRLGITVDLKNHTAQLLPDDKSLESAVAELHESLTGCEEAFNRADEATFAECLDPQVVTFTAGGDFYGRDAALAYYRIKYFQHDPPARLYMTSRAHHLIGDAIWVEYDLKIILGSQVIQARGTALCRKDKGRWRIVHMIHSSPPPTELQAQTEDQQHAIKAQPDR